MRLAADDYRDAAAEHIETARLLHDAGRDAAAHYIAGLAVECVFRAYRRRQDPTFDARHDLDQLFVLSGFAGTVADRAPNSRSAIKRALVEGIIRWRNSHRFGSEETLRRFLKSQKLDRGIRGDFLKENSRRICEASDVIVRRGLRLW